MKNKQGIRAIIALLSIMLLIVDNKCALNGSKQGLDLCVRTVIPSLFPFFFLSMMLTTSMENEDSKLLRRLSGYVNIPKAAAPIVVPAFLGGYPVGAKSVADMYRNGILTKQMAEKLLAFCSNAGPSFLFGMVSVFFPDKKMVWKLWVIHILGALFVANIYPRTGQDEIEPHSSQHILCQKDLMLSSLSAIGIVCGWVILFRILISFLNQYVFGILPPWIQVVVIGILELSNGCCELMRISDVGLRFVICSSMLAFGGVCVLLQTISVLQGLSIRHYLIGKSIQSIFSLILSTAAIKKPELLYISIVAFLLGIPFKQKIKGRNLRVYPV